MKFSNTIYKVFIGLLVFARELLPVCSSALDTCGKPCEPKHFCNAFLGFCLLCADYCKDINDACHTTCDKSKQPHSTTITGSTNDPISSPDMTTVHPITNLFTSPAASDAVMIDPRNYSSTSPGGGGGGVHKILPNQGHGLFFGLFISMVVFTIIIGLLVKYRKSLKMRNMWCIFTGVYRTSPDIELGEIESRPRQDVGEWNIVPNPMTDQTRVGQPTTSGYALVQPDDVGDEDVINQPEPSGLQSPPKPDAEVAEAANLVQPACAPVNEDRPYHAYQSASVRLPNAPRRECTTLLKAVPTDRQSQKQKTPETHRKVADGTHKGHELTTGASQFEPLFQAGDFSGNQDSRQGE